MVALLYGYEIDESKSSMTLIMDFMDKDYELNLKRTSVSCVYFAQFFVNAVDALLQLREKRVIHRDISTGNFLYCPFYSKYQLIDFDLSVYADENGEYLNYEIVGTDPFIPEEIVNSANYSFHTDRLTMVKVIYEVFFHVVCDLLNPEPDEYSIQLCEKLYFYLKNSKNSLENARKKGLLTLIALYERHMEEILDLNVFHASEEYLREGCLISMELEKSSDPVPSKTSAPVLKTFTKPINKELYDPVPLSQKASIRSFQQ